MEEYFNWSSDGDCSCATVNALDKSQMIQDVIRNEKKEIHTMIIPY